MLTRSLGRSVRRTCASKLLFTIGIMAIFRLGSFIPTPGVAYPACRRA